MTQISLSKGKTAYQILGNPEAPQWVLVFGGFHFPRNCDAFFQSLADKLGDSHALLLYDYWGRGDSDAPDGLYDADFYVQQAEELLEKLSLADKQFTVMGYSFGGAVSSHFIRTHPDRVKATIYSGAWATWKPFPLIATLFCKWGMSNLFYKLYNNALRPSVDKGFDAPSQHVGIIDNMFTVENEIMAKSPGNLKKALLATFRNFSRNTRAAVEEQAKQGRPVLFAWGKNDAIASFSAAQAMHAITPNSTLIGLDGNHNDIWLVPAKIEPFQAALVAFLQKHNH